MALWDDLYEASRGDVILGVRDFLNNNVIRPNVRSAPVPNPIPIVKQPPTAAAAETLKENNNLMSYGIIAGVGLLAYLLLSGKK